MFAVKLHDLFEETVFNNSKLLPFAVLELILTRQTYLIG